MNYFKRTHFLLIVSIIAFFYGISFSWERIDSDLKNFDKYSPPIFNVKTLKDTYLTYEPIVLRFIIANNSDKDIVTYISLPGAPIESGSVHISISGPDKNIHPWYQIKLFQAPLTGIMHSKELIFRDYKLSYNIKETGQYTLRANYTWRGSQGQKDSYQKRRAKANEIHFGIEEPTNVDKEALMYVKDPIILMALQDNNDLLLSGKDKELQDLRIKFIEKYTKSIYAKNILFSLALHMKRNRRNEEAIIQFYEYIRSYPTSWFVDVALFNIAECQIELGKLGEAKKTIEKLLHMEADGSIQLKAKRIKRNLEKGYKTLDEIYSH